MILFPAIDIKDGKVVRLRQGDYNQVTPYAEDPLHIAKAWQEKGARWLHVVDLDAAKAGQPIHAQKIFEIAAQTGLRLQVGGGIRNLEMARTYLAGGVEKIVVGTQAIRKPEFLQELAAAFPGKIALGLDAKNGSLAVDGWTETTETRTVDFLRRTPLEGVAWVIFTDISRDGMLNGPNLESLSQVLEASPIPVVASGGISCLDDLVQLQNLNHPRLQGMIAGKALYENRFTLEEALAITGSNC